MERKYFEDPERAKAEEHLPVQLRKLNINESERNDLKEKIADYRQRIADSGEELNTSRRYLLILMEELERSDTIDLVGVFNRLSETEDIDVKRFIGACMLLRKSYCDLSFNVYYSREELETELSELPSELELDDSMKSDLKSAVNRQASSSIVKYDCSKSSFAALADELLVKGKVNIVDGALKVQNKMDALKDLFNENLGFVPDEYKKQVRQIQRTYCLSIEAVDLEGLLAEEFFDEKLERYVRANLDFLEGNGLTLGTFNEKKWMVEEKRWQILFSVMDTLKNVFSSGEKKLTGEDVLRSVPAIKDSCKRAMLYVKRQLELRAEVVDGNIDDDASFLVRRCMSLVGVGVRPELNQEEALVMIGLYDFWKDNEEWKDVFSKVLALEEGLEILQSVQETIDHGSGISDLDGFARLVLSAIHGTENLNVLKIGLEYLLENEDLELSAKEQNLFMTYAGLVNYDHSSMKIFMEAVRRGSGLARLKMLVRTIELSRDRVRDFPGKDSIIPVLGLAHGGYEKWEEMMELMIEIGKDDAFPFINLYRFTLEELNSNLENIHHYHLILNCKGLLRRKSFLFGTVLGLIKKGASVEFFEKCNQVHLESHEELKNFYEVFTGGDRKAVDEFIKERSIDAKGAVSYVDYESVDGAVSVDEED